MSHFNSHKTQFMWWHEKCRKLVAMCRCGLSNVPENFHVLIHTFVVLTFFCGEVVWES